MSSLSGGRRPALRGASSDPTEAQPGQCPASPDASGHLKGLAVKRRGMRRRMPYTEMDNTTPAKLALISQRARKETKFQFSSLAHLLNQGFLKGL